MVINRFGTCPGFPDGCGVLVIRRASVHSGTNVLMPASRNGNNETHVPKPNGPINQTGPIKVCGYATSFMQYLIPAS